MNIDFPTWVDKAVLAGLLAAVGYVGNLSIQSIGKWRETRATQRASLLKLAALLKTMAAAYAIQVKHRDALHAALNARLPGLSCCDGYEAMFSSLFERFNASEKETHAIIRGISVHALRPLNDAVFQWLDDDVFYRSRRRTTAQCELAGALDQLAIHLSLWRAKYEIWIPDQPSHALVYLADEKLHGIGFPTGIESLIAVVLHRRRVVL